MFGKKKQQEAQVATYTDVAPEEIATQETPEPAPVEEPQLPQLPQAPATPVEDEIAQLQARINQIEEKKRLVETQRQQQTPVIGGGMIMSAGILENGGYRYVVDSNKPLTLGNCNISQ